jgi:dihydroorotate dehydrogenase (NAD+) catalytic subunit
MVNLAVQIAGVHFPNPTVVASGILGVTASSAGFAVAHGAGGVTLKSCGLEPRTGHRGPTILPVPGGLLNAVGLSNPGAEAVGNEIRAFKELQTVPIIASIFGRTEEEFSEVAAIVCEAQPDLLEINVSCPNVASEFGTPFGLDHKATARITRLVKDVAGSIPVLVKLSPQAHSIGALAHGCQEAGADGITAINSVGPGMAIDVHSRRPILSNRVGGLSGRAVLPVAVRCVHEIAQAVDIPIIGTGGVTTCDDALQMILAGATAVAIGTGIHTEGIGLFTEISQGIAAYLEAGGFLDLTEIRGAVHGQ